MTRMTRIGVLIAAVVVTGGAIGAAGRLTPPAPRAIVLAELFTSEGCSSCPPADALLRRLVSDQPIEDVEVVALGNHVDYWDQLGWRDPFSSAIFSQRQSSYSANVFRSGPIYTPQIVVDGSLEAVGSDEAAVRRNILKAGREPKAILDVSARRATDGTVRIDVLVHVPDQVKRTGTADVVVAVTEDDLVSHVQHGENGGRTLSHSAVVRLLKTVAQVRVKDQIASGVLMLKLEKDWIPDHLHLVAFMQEQTSRRILGTGVTRLTERQGI